MKTDIPAWLEKLIINGIKDYIPASVVAEAIEEAKAYVIDYAANLAASTENKLDDLAVEKLKESLETCGVDDDFLCDLIQKGEVAIVDFLRKAALNTKTGIDDAFVELFAEAIGAPKA